MEGYTPYRGNPQLVMTWRQWLTYCFDPFELLLNCSAVDGSDFHQAHPIGLAVFLMPAMPEFPVDFHPQPQHETTEYLANAIFCTHTTRKKGHIRDHAARQLADKPFIFQDIRQNKTRLDPAATLDWYCRTPFTISPRGAGLDCHRTYEALICKSLPIVLGADESLRLKYFKLPVRFVDSYAELSPVLLNDWYQEALDTVYDFNFLAKSYWVNRRPDVNLTYQSVFWLKRYGMFDYVKRYFREHEQSIIERINPKRHHDR